MSQALTVSQLIYSIKKTLEENPNLNHVDCVGEISNLTKSKAGHWYFSLKDEKSKINCVMFYSQTLKISTPIQEGDEVLIKGSVSVYAGSGQVQVVISQMSLNGQGALYKKYLELRDMLHKQGYFNQSHKKEIPQYPMSIGVIVGAQSAAQADILKTLQSRWPIAQIKMYESLVQGVMAPAQLIDKVKEADLDDNDVVLLARGGGSLEDLWAFNDVELVMTIFKAKTPIITGVGHEIDVTLVDYVADLRGLTPTDAALKATPDQREIMTRLNETVHRLRMKVESQLQTASRHHKQIVTSSLLSRPQLLLVDKDQRLREVKESLNQYHYRFQSTLYQFDKVQQSLFQSMRVLLQKGSHDMRNVNLNLHTKLLSRIDKTTHKHSLITQNLLYSNPIKSLGQKRDKLDSITEKLSQNLEVKLNKQINAYKLLEQQLQLKSPLNWLEKGYVLSIQDDQILRSIKQVDKDKPIKIVYKDGQLMTKVQEIINE